MRNVFFTAVIILFFAGCAISPEQRVVDRSDIPVTGDAVDDVSDEGQESPDDGSSDEDSVDAEDDPGAMPGGVWEDDMDQGQFPGESETLTASWAYRETLPLAREWSPDARLYWIRGVNLIEGRLTEDSSVVSGTRFYSSNFVVSYVSDSTGNTEVLDFKVEFDGVSRSGITRFIPESVSTTSSVVDWNVDSEGIAGELAGIGPTLGYSIKTLDITSAGAIKADAAISAEVLVTDAGDMARDEVYGDIDDDTPIGLAQAHTGVLYEVDLTDGSILGYRRVRR